MTEFETIQEIVLKAHRKMTPELWDHISGGAESETTLWRNRYALDRMAFRPRVLRDVTKIDATTTLLGRKMRIPVFFAPMGGMMQLHPEGALPCMRTAAAFGSIVFLSSVSELDLESAASTGRENLIFQLYMQGDRAWLDAYLNRVEESRCRAFCLTVDTAVYSRRERDLLNRFAPPGRRGKPRAGFNYQAEMTWGLVDKVKKRLRIPLVLKGVSNAEDARLALEHGVDVIYVSNHGGRQLDHCCGSLDALPEVVEAVDRKAAVVVDGGFLRGTDVLKAIALGASCVGIGKLQAWALAAGGEEALTRMMEILENEIHSSMALLGVSSLAQLNSSYLRPDVPVKHPDEFSPFPLVQKSLKR